MQGRHVASRQGPSTGLDAYMDQWTACMAGLLQQSRRGGCMSGKWATGSAGLSRPNRSPTGLSHFEGRPYRQSWGETTGVVCPIWWMQGQASGSAYMHSRELAWSTSVTERCGGSGQSCRMCAPSPLVVNEGLVVTDLCFPCTVGECKLCVCFMSLAAAYVLFMDLE